MRDLLVRYKRSLLGIWWSLLNPILTTLVLFYVFNSVFQARMTDGASFAPYLLSGVLIITFFNQGLTMAAEAIASGAGVLTKIYAPAHVFAASAASAGAINFMLGLLPLGVVTLIASQSIAPKAVFVLAVAFCLTLLVTGLSLFVATAYIRYDDTRSIVALVLMMLTYMTPVFYPKSILGDTTRMVVSANPLTSYLECFRWAFGGNGIATTFDWLYMFGTAFVAFWLGVSFFRRTWPRTVAML
jgi:ABC-2 type transport system permease protein